MSVDYRAAWLPFDPDNGQTAAGLRLAVSWVERESKDQGRAALLVTPRKDIDQYEAPLREFAARHEWGTRRGGMRRRPAGGRPVLVHWPMFDDLVYASSLARGASLCATEWPGVPLAGWASAVGALNLVTGETTPRPGDDMVALLDHLRFAGNNGWFDAPGKRDALRLLGELRAVDPRLDARFIAGYMLGMGKGASAVENLVKLAGKKVTRSREALAGTKDAGARSATTAVPWSGSRRDGDGLATASGWGARLALGMSGPVPADEIRRLATPVLALRLPASLGAGRSECEQHLAGCGAGVRQ